MSSVLIRVDATKEVALGHLKRCISLALKFREKGVKVVFLTVKDDFTQQLLKNLDFDHKIVETATNSDSDYNILVKTAEELRSTIIVIDSYEIDNSYRNQLIDKGLFIVSIDDIDDKVISSHAIINGNLNAEYLKYENAGNASLFLGIKYLILSPDYWNINRLVNIDKVDNILITMGGIDHYDLSSKILDVLDRFNFNIDITVIIGPYYDNLDLIKAQASKMGKKVNLVNSPTSLYPYMEKSSLAFSAGGQTLYELAALGLPTIGVALWRNQAGNIGELSKMGSIIGLTYSEDNNFPSLLAEGTKNLINDSSLRKQLSQNASSLVDGKGAERTVSAIMETYSKWKLFNSKKENV